MKSEKEIIKELETAIGFLKMGGNTRVYAFKILKEEIWQEHKGKTMELFLEIQERERKEMKAREQELYIGLQASMHHNSTFAKYLLGDKNAVKKAKTFTKEILLGDNIAFSIPILKAYFPKGVSDGASKSGEWLFNKFTEQVLQYKEDYVEGGSSRDWAKQHGYAEYIDLIIEKYSK